MPDQIHDHKRFTQDIQVMQLRCSKICTNYSKGDKAIYISR